MLSFGFKRFRRGAEAEKNSKIKVISNRIFIALTHMTRSLLGKFFIRDSSVRTIRHLVMMKNLILTFLLLFIFSFSSFSQDTIWYEGFNYPDNTTDPGKGKCSIDVSDCDFLVLINISSRADLEIIANVRKRQKVFFDLKNKSTNRNDLILY